MIWISLASAAPGTGLVDAVVWARPFTLAEPAPDPTAPMAYIGAPRATFDRGWLLELRADPALLVPSDYAEPWLYAGEAHGKRYNWDHVGGCLVVLVPGDLDLTATPLALGAPPASTVNTRSGRAALALSELARLGAQPRPATEISAAIAAGGPALAGTTLDAVDAVALQRVSACTSTPEDLLRSGVPAR